MAVAVRAAAGELTLVTSLYHSSRSAENCSSSSMQTETWKPKKGTKYMPSSPHGRCSATKQLRHACSTASGSAATRGRLLGRGRPPRRLLGRAINRTGDPSALAHWGWGRSHPPRVARRTAQPRARCVCARACISAQGDDVDDVGHEVDDALEVGDVEELHHLLERADGLGRLVARDEPPR
eukprot:5596215-Prymnesium_polylepis.1